MSRGKREHGADPHAAIVPTGRLRALAEATQVGQIMSREGICLAPSAEVRAVTEMFLERDCGSAPVVDGETQPLALVSRTHLLRYYASGQKLPDSLAAHLAGAEGASVGAAAVRSPAAGPCPRPDPQPAVVADVTPPHVISLHEEASISVAAALMAHEGIHRLPIVRTGGQVVGILSTLDIVRWLAEATGMGPQDGRL